MSSATILAWYLPTWVNFGYGVTSPIAQTPSAARSRSSTGIPSSSGSMPTVSRPMSSIRGLRPVATSSLSPSALSAPSKTRRNLSPWRSAAAASLAEPELDPLGLEALGQCLAGFRGDARKQPLGALDDRHRDAHAGERLRQLAADRARRRGSAAAPAAPWRGRLAVGPDAVHLVEPSIGGIALRSRSRPRSARSRGSRRRRRPCRRPRSSGAAHQRRPSSRRAKRRGSSRRGRTTMIVAPAGPAGVELAGHRLGSPGARRASARASPGRSRVFEGMQPQ